MEMAYGENGANPGNEQKRERSRRIYSTKQIDEIIREANQGYEVDMFPFYDADIKLRGSGVIFNMTAEELEEYQKCYDNPEYFIDNYGVFRTDDGDRTVELRPYQKKVIDVVTAEHYDASLGDMIPDNRNIIYMAARQTGKCFSYLTEIETVTDKKRSITLGKLWHINKKSKSIFDIVLRCLYTLYAKL